MDKIKEMAIEIAGIIEDKKGNDIVILDLKGHTSIADYFVIATGLNDRHTAALAEHIESTLEAKQIRVSNKEGHNGGEWVILDYFDIIVHVFNEENRNYYKLDQLWKAATRIEPVFS